MKCGSQASSELTDSMHRFNAIASSRFKKHFPVLSPQYNSGWEKFAETEAYFEVKNQSYYKNCIENLEDFCQRCKLPIRIQ